MKKLRDTIRLHGLEILFILGIVVLIVALIGGFRRRAAELYDEGYQAGYAAGYDQGGSYDTGYDAGYQSGYRDALDDYGLR